MSLLPILTRIAQQLALISQALLPLSGTLSMVPPLLQTSRVASPLLAVPRSCIVSSIVVTVSIIMVNRTPAKSPPPPTVHRLLGPSRLSLVS